MKGSKGNISKAKRLAILSSLFSITKTYPKVNANIGFSLSSEKHSSTKTDGVIAKSIITNFFEEVQREQITASDVTVLNFCNKVCNLLIEDSAGNDKIRGYEAIKRSVEEELSIANNESSDDSHKLVKALM